MTLTRIVKDDSWQEDAACKGVDPALFFPDRGKPGTEAKAICATCPVKAPCLAYALTPPAERYGVWAGLSEKQRRRIRSRAATTNDMEVAS